MNYGRFEKEARLIKKERACNVFFVSFFALMLVFIVFFGDVRFLVLDLLLVALLLLFLFALFKNNRLLKQFSVILENNTESLSYEISLYRPKVMPLLIGKSRGISRHVRMNYYGVEIKAADKKKYYYFLGECRTFDQAANAKIQEKFDRELTLQCYQGTTIVCTIENDPYFVRF